MKLLFTLYSSLTVTLIAAESRALDKEGRMTSMTLHSAAFEAHGRIPEKYTADGENISPPLTWLGVPKTAKELVLIMDDPDAPQAKPWVHWLIYHIPPSRAGLTEETPAQNEVDGMIQGTNSFGTIGYRGPQPPKTHGDHHYHFTIYALDALLIGETPGLSKEQLLQRMQGHVIGTGELIGVYSRRE